MKDKVEKVDENSKEAIENIISYATKDKTDEIVYLTLNSTQNCVMPNDPIRSFQINIKQNRGKLRRENPRTKNGKEVLAWHLWQSFESVIDPRMANEIGCKLAKEVFPDFPATISTHTNTDNTHNHIVVCAWNLDGRKWNDCHETKRLIRRASDRLCKEYGLGVLEKTQDMRLKKYRDKNGKIRYFEVTDRKIEKLKERQEKEVFDIGDYRNTEAYQECQKERLTNIEIVKNDIDRFLPVSEDYEDLLRKLRGIHYEIKDKKADGSWRRHITFISPIAEKGVRDSSLDPDGFYLRKNLENYLSNLHEKENQKKNQAYKYHENYEFGFTNIDDVDIEYHVLKDGTLRKRSQPEKILIKSIKNQYIKLQIYQRGNRTLRESKQEEIIRRIQDGFRNLEFVEEKKIVSLDQLKQESMKIRENYNRCINEFESLTDRMEKLDKIKKIPEKMLVLQSYMETHSSDLDYQENEMDIDKELLRTYESIIKEYKIETKEGYQKFEELLRSLKQKWEKLSLLKECYEVEIERYEQCQKVFQTIEQEYRKEKGYHKLDRTKK